MTTPRPGLSFIMNELRRKNPTWSTWRLIAEAKIEWAKRNGN